MQFKIHSAPGAKIPVLSRLSLALWIVAALALLFTFTLAFLIIAAGVALVVLILNLWGRFRGSAPTRQRPISYPKPTQRPSPSRDDDIIDI